MPESISFSDTFINDNLKLSNFVILNLRGSSISEKTKKKLKIRKKSEKYKFSQKYKGHSEKNFFFDRSSLYFVSENYDFARVAEFEYEFDFYFWFFLNFHQNEKKNFAVLKKFVKFIRNNSSLFVAHMLISVKITF